jgi:hypothetical protein
VLYNEEKLHKHNNEGVRSEEQKKVKCCCCCMYNEEKLHQRKEGEGEENAIEATTVRLRQAQK